MPYKDQSERLAYLDAWRAKYRPSPEIQEREGLPPIGAYEYSADGSKIRCHVCGEWFCALNTHLRGHGLNASTYKELYGLQRTSSILSPATAEKQRQAALERDQGAVGREYIPRGSIRPKGLDTRLQTRVQASQARRGRPGRPGRPGRKKSD